MPEDDHVQRADAAAEGAEGAGTAVDAAPGHPSPWFVALDVDGTILHEDETLDLKVIEAVLRARDAGHVVTLATGRSWETTRPILERLGIAPEYVVCANGALILRRDDGPDGERDGGWRREHIETFDPAGVLRRIREYLPQGSFMVEDPTGFRLYTAGMDDWNLDNAREVEFDDLLHTPATRVVVISPGHDLDEFLAIVEQMGLHQVSYAIGWTAWLDIAPEGVNKATALERVRERLGVPSDRLLAVGDGRNDIEMFEWAGADGRAVAMGQAPDEVKAAATEVTGDIDHDGVVAALDALP